MSPQTVLLRTTLTRTITIYRIIIVIIIIIITKLTPPREGLFRDNERKNLNDLKALRTPTGEADQLAIEFDLRAISDPFLLSLQWNHVAFACFIQS